MKDLLAKTNINNINIQSRGLDVFSPLPISTHTETILSKQDIHISPHCSTLLKTNDFTNETLILTMTYTHKQRVDKIFPAYSNQTYTLSEYVTGSHMDIQDPYGGDINIYRACFLQLKELLTILVENLPRL